MKETYFLKPGIDLFMTRKSARTHTLIVCMARNRQIITGWKLAGEESIWTF